MFIHHCHDKQKTRNHLLACHENMKLYLEHEFETIFEIDPSDFRDRLIAHVEKPTIIRRILKNREKVFYGEVTDETFRIWRITGQRKGSIPNLEGYFQAQDCRTKVSVVMKPDPQIFTFVIAWTIGTLGLALIATVYYGTMQFTTVSSLLLFCAGNLAVYQHFWSEVPKSKEKFFKIFED